MLTYADMSEVLQVLSTEDFAQRAASYGPNKPVYFFTINSEMVIDAAAMGSMARFINHSCGPNCHTGMLTYADVC
jgi:hypothetical protein